MRLDKHEEELIKLREDMNRLREDMNRGFRRYDSEMAKLREDMNRGFRRYDQEIARLREDMIRGFQRYDAEIAKLREDMNRGFMRHDQEIARLREDMNRGFELIERHISALGARWGLLTEEAFRAGLKGLIEKEFGLKIERWTVYDEEGIVFGYPSQVEVDVAVHNEKVILIEVKAHVDSSDLYSFKRKAELYEMKTGRKPSRLIVVTPYIEGRAMQAAKSLKIEVYTNI
ncbi:hypothetical protein DRO64_02670 [Candidatus Bathyarchaeota archaeon]|nr:MAG: hypothetical protein DRO64_02670 [Candidatus Bathyarchaeota archaeon]HDM88643.1 DUF3782 domain-containing protein [Candidatus Bathyarchaeota archaeon]